MKYFIWLLLTVFIANGENIPKVTFHTWVDIFGLNKGLILYPQYSWAIKTSYGTFDGYGFLESTPNEKMFTNNLVVYTPSKIKFFSVHTETGGFPRHNLGFFQIGARINTREMFPQLKRPFSHLFIVGIPRFIGIRPNNILVSGGTNPIKIKDFQLWIDAYYRFFPSGHPYGEWWILLKQKGSNLSYGALIHHTGKNNYVGFGLRYFFF